MFDRDFFTSKLGVAALVSIAAITTCSAVMPYWWVSA